MFSFEHFVPVKRLAGKFVSNMTRNVSSWTLNPTELLSFSCLLTECCSVRWSQWSDWGCWPTAVLSGGRSDLTEVADRVLFCQVVAVIWLRLLICLCAMQSPARVYCCSQWTTCMTSVSSQLDTSLRSTWVSCSFSQRTTDVLHIRWDDLLVLWKTDRVLSQATGKGCC